MPVYLSHQSALDAWRLWSRKNAWPLAQFHQASLGPAKATHEVLPSSTLPATQVFRTPLSGRSAINALEKASLSHEAKAFLLDRPLHILVSPKSPGTACSETIVQHFGVGSFPRGSFLKLNDTLFASSPDLLFIQLAQDLPFGSLVALGYELCGCYPTVDSGPGTQIRRPLTTPDRLASFCEKAVGLKGAKTARRAASLIRGRSASPMESEIGAIASLPGTRGGYSLPESRANLVIPLSETSRLVGRARYIVGDICWPQKKVVLEYNGVAAHADRFRQASDSRKVAALRQEDWTVFTLTSDQFNGIDELQAIIGQIADALGKRFRISCSDFLSRHLALRQEMRDYHQNNLGRFESSTIWQK